MLDELQWSSLQERRRKSRLKMLHKVVNGIVALPAEQYLVPAVNHHTHQSRHHQFTPIPAEVDLLEICILPKHNP